MPPDSGLPEIEPRPAAPADPRAGARLDRPLGRGLEDVSHLFLTTPRPADAPGGTAGDRAGRPVPPPPIDPRAARPDPTSLSEPRASRSDASPIDPRPETERVRRRHVLLSRKRTFGRDDLAAAVWDFMGALEEGLRGIDRQVDCGPCGAADMIARDGMNRLAIVDVETSPKDRLLLRAVAHGDWVMRNAATLQRLYPEPLAGAVLPPRLFLVAPRFSPIVRRVIRQIRPQVTCVRYFAVDVYGGTGMLFERVDA